MPDLSIFLETRVILGLVGACVVPPMILAGLERLLCGK